MRKFIRNFLKPKKQKFDSLPKITETMKGNCFCDSPCNEFCDNKKEEKKTTIIEMDCDSEILESSKDRKFKVSNSMYYLATGHILINVGESRKK